MQRIPSALWLFRSFFVVACTFSAEGKPSTPLPHKPVAAGEVRSFLQEAQLTRRRVFGVAFEMDGTAWLAASDGLYRYDGYDWQRLTREEHGLPTNFVRSVTVTRAGRIWVGTQEGAGVITATRPILINNEGGSRASGSAWRFDLLAPPDKMAGPSVRRIVEDPDGTLWFCNDAWPSSRSRFGLSSLSRDGSWRTYGPKQGLPAHPLCYFRASDGAQYLAIQKDSPLFRKEGEQWVQTTSPKGMFWSIVEDPVLGVIARSGNRVCRLHDGQWTILAEEGAIHPLLTIAAGELLSSMMVRDGTLAIGRWTGTGFTQISPLIPSEFAMVEELKQSPDGAVWIVGDNLLARWDRSPSGWRWFPTLPLPAGRAADGTVWFASGDRSVSMRNGQFAFHKPYKGRPVVSPDGSLWRWFTHGAARFRASEFDPWTVTSQSASLEEITGCMPEKEGGAWLHSLFGLARVGANKPPVEFPLIVHPQLMSSGALDPLGKLWILTLSGLTDGARIVTADGELHSSIPLPGTHFYESKLHIDPHGTFWVYGTKGLYRFATETRTWERIEEVGGTNILTHLDTRGTPWFAFDARGGGHSGIGFLENGKWVQRLCDVNGSAAAAPNGDLFFSGEKELYIVPQGRLAELRAIALPEGVRVTHLLCDLAGSVWLGGIHPDRGEATYQYACDRLAPKVRLLRGNAEAVEGSVIRMEAIGVERFRATGDGRKFLFSWKLPAGEWSPFQNLPASGIPISGLGMGSHQVGLRCLDDDGDVSPPVLLDVSIMPLPLQSRPWFRPIATALFLLLGMTTFAAIHAAARFRAANRKLRLARTELETANQQLEQRVEERTSELEQQIAARQSAEVRFTATLAERNRLARELHDTLEQGLAGLRMQIESARMSAAPDANVARSLAVASEILKYNQTEVRRSIHNLRSETLEQFDLPTAFAVACKQVINGSGVKLNVVTSGESKRYSATVENSLLRIGQEAVTNAVKHARATHVSVEFVFGAEQLRIAITDNGVGFDTTKLLRHGDGHFGILGMKERAERLGGKLQIESSPSGTQLALLVGENELLHCEDE